MNHGHEKWKSTSKDGKPGLLKADPSQAMWLNVVALNGDSEGGTHEGSALIPADLGPAILDRIKDILGDELARLGADVPLDPEATMNP